MDKKNARSDLHEQLFAQFARVGKAISSPARLELLHLLSQGEKSVEQVARGAGLTVANTSQHLQQLKSARMVVSRKEGQQVQYSLAAQSVHTLLYQLQAFGVERLLEVQELLSTHLAPLNGTSPIRRDEALKMIESKKITPLDIRPNDEFLSGHLPSAISVPFSDIEGRMDELKREKPVLIYSRSGFSEDAYQAVAVLRKAGLEANRLEGGWPDWARDGLPSER